MVRCTYSMQLRSELSWRRNHSRWLFATRAHMMWSFSPLDVHDGFMAISQRGIATLWLRSLLGTHASFQAPLWSTKILTTEFAASVMYGEIVKKTSISPFQIMLAISNRYTYEISYDMARRSKQKALEWRFGSYKDSYHHLPHLLERGSERRPAVQRRHDPWCNTQVLITYN